jgi:FkbM family methyltransferase
LIDIGANVGLFSRQLAMVAPRLARIICVEPDRNNFLALRYNMDVPGARAEFHNVALGDADGEREFFRDSENIGNYSLNPDAMRHRSFESVTVRLRKTSDWMEENLAADRCLLWKSDTQGFDEVIVAETPLAIWQRIDVALIEVWRIAKPEFDRQAFRFRLEAFPNRQLGDVAGVSVDAVLDYLSGDDWQFKELLLWK